MTARNRCLLAAFSPALLAAGCILLAGCARAADTGPAGVLPGADSIPGWKAADETSTFTHETLFDYIDGASEYYFTYSFEEVATNRYIKEDGTELYVELWRLSDAKDAFGLFSGRTAGEEVAVGAAAGALLESGSRLTFWQDRYFANLSAVDTVADEDLMRFADYLSQSLPAGGEPPPIIGRLPAGGLIPGSAKFFHLELAVQDRIWLGGENLLGLGPETDAVLARYQAGGGEWQLLLVEYPDAAGAQAGLRALGSGAAGDLLAADAAGSLLGAVFGAGDETAARSLLGQALGE